jgi:hypothetical protein
MTTTIPHDITPPPGADFIDDWQQGPRPYRVILGAARVVGNVDIQTSCVQFGDGAIDQAGLIDVPKVHVRSIGARDDLTVEQARELEQLSIPVDQDRLCG